MTFCGRIPTGTAPFIFCRAAQTRQQYGSDKSSTLGVHDYTPTYQALFADDRLSVRKVLEIGIGYRFYNGSWMAGNKQYQTGASLRAWRDFLPNASVFGCDIERSILFDDERIHTFFMDQSKPDQASVVKSAAGDDPFDFILDDGSHIGEHQFMSAMYLFQLVKPGGFYIIEDVAPKDMTMLNNVIENAKRYNVPTDLANEFLAQSGEVTLHERNPKFASRQGIIVVRKKA